MVGGSSVVFSFSFCPLLFPGMRLKSQPSGTNSDYANIQGKMAKLWKDPHPLEGALEKPQINSELLTFGFTCEREICVYAAGAVHLIFNSFDCSVALWSHPVVLRVYF